MLPFGILQHLVTAESRFSEALRSYIIPNLLQSNDHPDFKTSWSESTIATGAKMILLSQLSINPPNVMQIEKYPCQKTVR